ncbi:MAG TPA: adenosylmethionine decarboxylase [Gaiellaceae bacterium]|nr:adenosylmethionine decarboxylase [Gaiellaceae bacterium]
MHQAVPAEPTTGPLRMRLWTLDADVADPAVLTDLPRLRALLRAAAADGGATVLGEEFCTFANGAVTGVLVLAQSHLSVHTWPERSLANVDLLSCGEIDGERVVRAVAAGLGAVRARVACHRRTVC